MHECASLRTSRQHHQTKFSLWFFCQLFFRSRIHYTILNGLAAFGTYCLVFKPIHTLHSAPNEIMLFCCVRRFSCTVSLVNFPKIASLNFGEWTLICRRRRPIILGWKIFWRSSAMYDLFSLPTLRLRRCNVMSLSWLRSATTTVHSLLVAACMFKG